MDFEDTPEEAVFRADAHAWLAAHAPAKGAPEDFSTGYLEGTMSEDDHLRLSKQWQGTLFDSGWAGITWPKRYGGRGGRPMEAAIFAQEQATFGVSVGAFAMGIGMAGPTIMKHGTDAERERFLAPMLRGDEVWCQLFSEPGAGSDLAGIATRAVRAGDEWVVTGQKVWTSSANHGDWGILLARTDPDAPKHKGITYFLVDMTSPGFDIRPLKQMTGASHFSEVFLDEVRIPHEQVLGEVHGGWACALTTLSNERGLIAGGNKASDTVALIALAQKLGRGEDAVLRQLLVDCWSRQQIQKYLGYRAQTAMSQGRQPGPETSIMKLFAAEYLRRLGNTALELLGADGMLERDGAGGGEWQARFLHAPAIRIAGGSNEIQRNIIGERVLGLPGDIRVDRDVPFRELGEAVMSQGIENGAHLTKAQAARRERVLRAALKLGADGGYDAVQMRDVATEADVALGTIYRYFSSKDHLLAAALVAWTGDLEQQVTRRPPGGDDVAQRVANVLQRATKAMEREPKLTAALITAISSPDKGAASCQDEVRAAMARVLVRAMPDDFDPEARTQAIRVLNFVWYGALLGWVNGWEGTDDVTREITDATHLLLDQFS